MSLAATSRRGAALNCRFAVNGIQKASRSFGIAGWVMVGGISLGKYLPPLSRLWRSRDRLFLLPINRLKSLSPAAVSLNMFNRRNSEGHEGHERRRRPAPRRHPPAARPVAAGAGAQMRRHQRDHLADR